MKPLDSIPARLGFSFGLAAILWSAAPALSNTITVITTNDNGAGSLRQTIQDATSGDTINFAVTGNIWLLSGELLVAKNLSILGPGATNLAVNGNLTKRVFEIASNAVVEISGLTIANGGSTNGGGIYNAGTLTVLQCALATNIAAGENTAYFASPPGEGGGGGIYNRGLLTVSQTMFQKNAAAGGNVLDSSGRPGGLGLGGAIYNAGTLSVNGSTFAANVAMGGSGGAGGNAWYGLNPSLGGTGGGGYGGAIFNAAQSVNLTNATFGGNMAAGGNGGTGGNGFWGYCHTFPGTPATVGAWGGAGGDGFGGGIYSSNGFFRIIASTLSGNFASGGHGGAGGSGGACFDGGGSAPSGNPGYPGDAVGGGINASNMVCQNTIIASNSTAFSSGPDVAGTVSSLGHNLVGTTNGVGGWVASDLTGSDAAPLDPKLGPLAYNGGPTFTMALLPGSPAIDQGTSGSVTTDQRGRLRPYDNPAIPNAAGGDGSDIGAFELQSPAPVFTGLQRSGSDILLNFLSEVGQNYRVERTDSLPPTNWATVADNLPGNGAILQVIDAGGAAQPKQFYRGKTLP
ncbi:MAG: hypothetical protein HY255_00680 [Betaproteobacteria bacterium]|nr:hypothetical protein [Betaproteobacteria bacterium]